MTEETALATQKDEAQMMESLLLGGDLSKLNPAQRVGYYRKVCASLGLNPLTKPFAYINLNGKLTLYALKDAADQLRKVHEVSIDDVDIVETETQFIVKVKGHDKTGRSDVEVGVVNKTDMRGDTANAQMKAVTKGKRRLTLSLCGLGMLDETEVQTIPDAHTVTVKDDTGEILDGEGLDEGESEPIEIVSVMGDWAVNEAATFWNIGKAEAAKQIGKQLKGKMEKREFLDWLKNPQPGK